MLTFTFVTKVKVNIFHFFSQNTKNHENFQKKGKYCKKQPKFSLFCQYIAKNSQNFPFFVKNLSNRIEKIKKNSLFQGLYWGFQKFPKIERVVRSGDFMLFLAQISWRIRIWCPKRYASIRKTRNPPKTGKKRLSHATNTFFRFFRFLADF